MLRIPLFIFFIFLTIFILLCEKLVGECTLLADSSLFGLKQPTGSVLDLSKSPCYCTGGIKKLEVTPSVGGPGYFYVQCNSPENTVCEILASQNSAGKFFLYSEKFTINGKNLYL